MLNAHTATRTFREMQFDIEVFLRTLYAIVTTTEEDDSIIVEAKWSDGSVDVLPALYFLKSFVGNVFPQLSVGSALMQAVNTSVSIQGGKYHNDFVTLKITCTNGVSAMLDSVGGSSVSQELDSCNIGAIEADIVTLEDDVKITNLVVTGLLSVSSAVTNTLVVNESAITDYAKVKRLNVSNFILNSYVTEKCMSNCLGTSCLLVYYLYNRYASTFNNVIHLTGCMSMLAQHDATSAHTMAYSMYASKITQNCKVQVYYPALGNNGEISYVTPTLTSTCVNGVDTEFPVDDSSVVSALTIYPKVVFNRIIHNEPSGDDVYVFLMLKPELSENNNVVKVYNDSGKDIKVCNVWGWTNNGAGSIVQSANHTITLPAYSQVDFLFNFKLDSKLNGYIYMLPLKAL